MHSLTRTPDYQDWVWDLTSRLRAALETAYSKPADEVECIRALVNGIAHTRPIGSPQAPRLRVTVDSAFLHGPRSQVTFSIGGVQRQRELADVLVLSSFVDRGSLKWQRVCLIQAKRDAVAGGVRKSAARFQVDEWQLALLRTFPRFSGVSGVFRGLTHQLRNQSGMLGAYGLLNAPGDVSIVSARVLYGALGGRKSLTGKELLPAILSEPRQKQTWEVSGPLPWWPLDPDHCPECWDMVEHFWPFPWRDWWRHHRHHHFPHRSQPNDPSSQPRESRLTCLTLEEFVEAWTSLELGELWFADSKASSDVVLRDLVLSLVSRVGSGSGSLQSLESLITASSGIEPPHRERRNTVSEPEESGGLIVLSAVGTAGGEG